MDCSPPGSSVCGILQARILEWVAIPFSTQGSSQPRDRTQVSHIAGGFFTIWATREAQNDQCDSTVCTEPVQTELDYTQCWPSKGRDHKLYEVWPKRQHGVFVFVCVGGVRGEHWPYGGWGWKKEGKMNDGCRGRLYRGWRRDLMARETCHYPLLANHTKMCTL